MDPDLLHLIGRLLLAGGLGAVLGAEREFHHKTAGLRTNILIAMGSALFTVMSIDLGRSSGSDGARIAAQIVTGVGFLGGGAILHTRGSVKGLTTAATIWMNAAIGVAAGAGSPVIAIAATVSTVAVLVLLLPVERFFDRLWESRGGRVNANGVIQPPASSSERKAP